MKRTIRFEGVRLPGPSPDEARGFPVTVFDALGVPLATLTTDEWLAQVPRCRHGWDHCHACRHGLHEPERRSDRDLIEALAG